MGEKSQPSQVEAAFVEREGENNRLLLRQDSGSRYHSRAPADRPTKTFTFLSSISQVWSVLGVFLLLCLCARLVYLGGSHAGPQVGRAANIFARLLTTVMWKNLLNSLLS